MQRYLLDTPYHGVTLSSQVTDSIECPYWRPIFKHRKMSRSSGRELDLDRMQRTGTNIKVRVVTIDVA